MNDIAYITRSINKKISDGMSRFEIEEFLEELRECAAIKPIAYELGMSLVASKMN